MPREVPRLTGRLAPSPRDRLPAGGERRLGQAWRRPGESRPELAAIAPMAFNLGTGGEANVPLARAVIGGLCASTAPTLSVVPALYVSVKQLAPPGPKRDLDAERGAVEG